MTMALLLINKTGSEPSPRMTASGNQWKESSEDLTLLLKTSETEGAAEEEVVTTTA